MADSPETSLITDYLTGLFNRRFFNAMLLNEVSRAMRHRVPVTMLLADLDHLKEANELHGYTFGDKVLKILARILESSIRQEDVVARYGADEFAILLPHTDLRGGTSGQTTRPYRHIRRSICSRAGIQDQHHSWYVSV